MKKLPVIVSIVLLLGAVSFAGPLPTCPASFTIDENAAGSLGEVFGPCTITGFQVSSGVVIDFVSDIPNANLSDVAEVSNLDANTLLVSFVSDGSSSLIEPPGTVTATDNGIPILVVAQSTTPGGLPLVLSFVSDADPCCGPGTVSDGGSFKVPEPAGLALVGSGLLGLGVILRRKVRKQA